MALKETSGLLGVGQGLQFDISNKLLGDAGLLLSEHALNSRSLSDCSFS